MQDERDRKKRRPATAGLPFAKTKTAKGRPTRVVQSLEGVPPAAKNLLELRAQIRIIVWL
jgi:hypothetical protein